MRAHDIDLWGLAAGSLEAEARLSAESHLATCDACRVQLDGIRQTQATLSTARDAQTPVRWSAVDDGVRAAAERHFAKAFRPRWVAVALAGGAAFAAIAVAVLWNARTTPMPEAPVVAEHLATTPLAPAAISTVEQSIEAERSRDDARAALSPGDGIREGDRLHTGRRGALMVRLPEKSRLHLAAESSLMISQATHDAVALKLERGRITSQATHNPQRAFRVEAGGVTVHIVGTIFSVAILPRGIEVSVAEGRVRVEQGERSVFVSSGERVRVKGELSKPEPMTASERVVFEPFGLVAPVKRHNASPPALRPPAEQPVNTPSAPITATPPPAPAPAVSTPVAPTEPPPEVRRTDALPETTEGIFLHRAEASLSNGSCEKFLEGLKELAAHNDDRESKSKARILRARCYDDRLKPDLARLEYQKYLEEFPSGPFNREARRQLEE